MGTLIQDLRYGIRMWAANPRPPINQGISEDGRQRAVLPVEEAVRPDERGRDRRLKQLEEENRKLKQLVADLSLVPKRGKRSGQDRDVAAGIQREPASHSARPCAARRIRPRSRNPRSVRGTILGER